ncbi:hypothetical protein VTL71DRAFT_9225 [Oculimacula yallundae]|uniref:Protein kinase domain-containing protein n=1 Tax=Oculimacula yallundae TaxID=86028 RepID=A0ABR4BSF0_9HELO
MEANMIVPSFSQGHSRIRPSRISALQDSYRPALQNLEAYGVDAITTALRDSGLPGPSVVVGPMTRLGQGGQFIVYKAELVLDASNGFRTFHIAAKQPIFDRPVELVNPVNMADRRLQLRLTDIATEIRALTTPALRHHPNIVRLISWAFDPYKVHQPITLAMELALSDLRFLLSKDNGKEVSCQQRYDFCVDIANGLDALHDNGLIHGDLKPGNVLVFQGSGDRLIAKLADFGLSTTGENDQGLSAQRLAGTTGWQAPEVEQGQLLLPRGLQLADNFSFGLLSLSTVFGSGEVPARDTFSNGDFVMPPAPNGTDIVVFEILTVMSKALPQLLNQNPIRRAHKLPQLFTLESRSTTDDSRLDNKQGNDILSSHQDPADVRDVKVPLDSFSRSENRLSSFHWELLGRPSEFWRSLLPRIMDDPEGGESEVIFAFFLVATGRDGRSFSNEISGYAPVTMLMAAASRGYPPAQAVIPEVLAFYQMDALKLIESHLVQYLESAVRSGSTGAKRHLQLLDAVIFSDSVRCFRDSGGYATFYRTKPPVLNELQELVSYGEVDQLRRFLLDNPGIDINSRTCNEESLLYLACTRGAWEIAIELLDRGADAKQSNTAYGVSCLHWIFVFDPSVQAEVVKRLLNSGVDINALTTWPVPFFHYPFILPAGTPLHWAVVLKENVTIQALVEAGADLTIRDSSDPYRYDERVRIISTVHNFEEDAFSYAECGTMGLAPWDHASKNRDPFIFQYLVSSGRQVHNLINAVDEEGFTVLHRLSTTHSRWTRSNICYSFMPFSGNSTDRQDNLNTMVEAIKALGGNLEQLTTPNASIAQANQIKGQIITFKRYTALMLAAMSGFADVVRALLNAGANPSTTNENGTSALHCLSHGNPDEAKEIVELLVKFGADIHETTKHGISVLQRAACFRNLPLLDTLLSYGANIEETDDNSRSHIEGSSCIAHFARRNYFSSDVFDESHDVALGRLLKKYLLGNDNADKRIRFVARRGRRQPQTLLHEFARCFMRHTIAALILCGAPVNASSTVEYWDPRAKAMIPREQYALDAVLRAKEWYEKDMLRNNGGMKSSNTEYLHIRSRANSVIQALKLAGGSQCPMIELEVPGA